MDYPLHRMHSSSTSRELPTKLVADGPRRGLRLQSFNLRLNGVGRRRLREAGKYAGPFFPKPHKLVGHSYFVVAGRAAEDIASVRGLVCSALLFACAVHFAQPNYCSNMIILLRTTNTLAVTQPRPSYSYHTLNVSLVSFVHLTAHRNGVSQCTG